MSSKKDMRRPDFVVPFVAPQKEKSDAAGDISSSMTTTLPMIAMFTRNKMIGWGAVIFSLQTWLAETPEQKRTASTPGYLSVGMSLMSVAVTYLPLFMPPTPGAASSRTEAPAAAPPA